jgi:hypothetical protein
MGRTIDDGRDKPAIYKLYDYTMGMYIQIFVYCKPVLGIHDILGWIRIRGSMPLTNGSGSGFGSGSWIRILDPDPAIFDSDLQDASKKLIF